MPALYLIPPRHFTRWQSPEMVTIDCPHKHAGCPFVAVRERDGEALRAIAKHLVRSHHEPAQEKQV